MAETWRKSGIYEVKPEKTQLYPKDLLCQDVLVTLVTPLRVKVSTLSYTFDYNKKVEKVKLISGNFNRIRSLI